MSIISRIKTASVALSLVTLAACGGGAPAGPQKLTLEGNDNMQFSAKQLKAEAGSPIVIEFKNAGEQPKETMGHNLVVLKKGVSVIDYTKKINAAVADAKTYNVESNYMPASLQEDAMKWTKVLGPGESETLDLPALEKGNYSYVCTFPGHVGVMNGTLTVK